MNMVKLKVITLSSVHTNLLFEYTPNKFHWLMSDICEEKIMQSFWLFGYVMVEDCQ
jgi:hypothetical protein